jgi:Domain of unknown function (DUF4157)/Protein-glutamine gamma-glutamyltransferase
MSLVQKSVAKISNRPPRIGQGVSEHAMRHAPLHPLLNLQSTIGNQAVLQLLRSGAIQGKLAINQPGDAYEQEADRVAEDVVSSRSPTLQRKCACGGTPGTTGDCAECHEKRRQHKNLSSKPVARTASSAPPVVHEVLRSPGQPLDPATRGLMESQFGHDFGNVRVHADSESDATARSVDAQAFTVGRHVAFRAGHYSPNTQTGRRLLGHELTHVVQQTDNAPALTLQRKVILNGAEMPVKDRKAFIKARKWANTALANAVMEDMAAATDLFDFADAHELESEIVKRVSTSEHMKESQATIEKIPGDKESAFGYPFSGASLLYGPRVNYAARDYWEPTAPDAYSLRTDKKKNKELSSLPRHERCKVYGDQCGLYSWKLSAKGKADPYEAIIKLFVSQPPHKRTLIHCDYLVSMVNFRSFADSIGVTEFNKRVKAYGVDKIRLNWNAFRDLEAEFYETVKVGGKDTLAKKKGLGSLQRVAPSSEADLIIGDHVVFFNHLAYDPLNENIGNAWRLENAVLIGKDSKGGDIFLGHGSGRKKSAELRAKLAEEFNDVAKVAWALVEKTKSKNAKTHAQASSDLSKKFPNVKPVGSEWHIQGKSGLCTTKTVDEKLRPPDKPLKGSEVLGPRDPCDPSKMYPVDRPIESAK